MTDHPTYDPLAMTARAEPADGEPEKVSYETGDADAGGDDGFALAPGEAQEAGHAYRFSRKLEILSDPASAQSASVGALRNHLSQQHLGLGRRSLAICSVSDDVNRSLVSASLAIAAAQAGASTVLVDANLREPALDAYFNPTGTQPGLSDYLDGRVPDPANIVAADVLPNLALVHAGTPTAASHTLLASRDFDDFLAGLMRSYDFTIVDCPAARHSGDTRRIASVVRYALIVTRQDVSYISDLKQLVDELTGDRVSVVGTFLNVG